MSCIGFSENFLCCVKAQTSYVNKCEKILIKKHWIKLLLMIVKNCLLSTFVSN